MADLFAGWESGSNRLQAIINMLDHRGAERGTRDSTGGMEREELGDKRFAKVVHQGTFHAHLCPRGREW